MRCLGVGTSGIPVQDEILGLLLERRFERIHRLVGPLAQFRRHDQGEVETDALTGHAFLELLQIRPGLVLVTQPGVGDGTVSIGDDSLRGLLDHGIEVVDCFLVLAKLDVGRSPERTGR